MRALLLGLVVAVPASAQEAMDGAKFEALVEGRSLAWAFQGQEPYGLERYFPGRRVLWLRTDSQECMEGKWWVEDGWNGPEICFVYEDDPLPICWHVRSKGQSLVATPDWGGEPVRSGLGPEHETPFGCGHLGF